MSNLNTDSYSSPRLQYLDSARGIAALCVVFGHFISGTLDSLTSFKFVSSIINHSDSVSFFFVLSGFVLSFKYLHNHRDLNVIHFAIKRVLRLYPARNKS